MKPHYISDSFLKGFLASAIQEDVGEGDHSTLACIAAEAVGKAQMIAKDEGVIAGIELAKNLMAGFDPSLEVDYLKTDGDWVKAGDRILLLKGPSRSILTIERLVLNCMQRMSGIATKTRHFTELIKGTGAKLLDTRKTTPGFRLLEKWAVLIGGGFNHRIGLYDMVMLKDNHIDMAGGIEQAIIQTKDYLRAHNKNLKIEIETRSIKEVEEVISVGGVDIIMLDNMPIDEMKKSVEIINKRFQTEASGGITEQSIRSVAECGVDFISVGALTHSYSSLDLSLKAL